MKPNHQDTPARSLPLIREQTSAPPAIHQASVNRKFKRKVHLTDSTISCGMNRYP